MQQLKVLHVIPSVGPLRGGPSAMVRRLAESLSSEGIEAHVATTNDNGPNTLDVACGVPVVEGHVTYWYFPRQARFYTFSWPLSQWLMRNVAHYDVVHIHALFSYASLPAAYWSRQRAVPYVVRPLGTLNRWGIENRRPLFKRWSFRLLESRILRGAACVHYTSKQERLEAESLAIRSYPSAIIPNAVAGTGRPSLRGAFRATYPHVSGRPIVLFLSRLDEKKGLDILLRAFQRVRAARPDALLVVAGEGPAAFVDQLKADAARFGIGDDVQWTGFVEGAEKDALLADADIFVLPSYSENFGIAAAEAMAAGLPVVVSDQVAIHTDVADAAAGVVVPCDSDAVAGAIERLLHDAAVRTEMGRRGAALAAERYSSAATARRVIALYTQLIVAQHGPTAAGSASRQVATFAPSD